MSHMSKSCSELMLHNVKQDFVTMDQIRFFLARKCLRHFLGRQDAKYAEIAMAWTVGCATVNGLKVSPPGRKYISGSLSDYSISEAGVCVRTV